MTDTIVCRCEEITENEIKKAVEQGARTTRDVKLCTRAGMGICQGHTCRPILERLVTHLTQESASSNGLSYRYPVRPVLLHELASASEETKE